MRALVAFDKFKDSMGAADACRVASDAIRRARAGCDVDVAPLTDGGEGFARILTEARGGELRVADVSGPRVGRVSAEWGMVALETLEPDLRRWLAVPAKGNLAVVEMAQASGLQGLPSELRDPFRTTTRGTGEVIREAVEAGASAILLGIGGSATNDMGLGALEALGLQFWRSGGAVKGVTPAMWDEIERITGQIMALPPIRIACDVSNPLLGPNGAAAVYGPQKGLRAADLPRMQAGMERMAKLLCAHAGKGTHFIDEPCGGAAGGIGFGFRVVADAMYVSGFEVVSRWLRLEPRVSEADVVITGEGRFDRSSLQGKGPGSLCRWAAAAGKPTWVFAGQIAPELMTCPPQDILQLRLRQISPVGMPLAEALRRAPELLALEVGAAFEKD